MQRLAARGLLDLLAATETVGHDQRVSARAANGRKQDTFANGLGNLVFPRVETERAGHPAAAGIGHAQVSDSNRFQPGAGHLDWPAWLGALQVTGYDGWLAAECRLTGDPRTAVASVPAFLRQAAG